MQPLKDKTTKMFFGTEEEVFNLLVKEDHAFRKLNEVIDFEKLTNPLRSLYSEMGTTGIDIEKGFRTLLVQFWEDYSDREMENAVRENIAIRWFCGFGLAEDTPDHSYFGKLRKRLGTENIARVFNEVNEVLRDMGLFGDVFKFIDASAIVSKTALWEERDKAIRDGEEKLNNSNVKDYAADKEARWGAKSKTNIWFGYKNHVAVDMRFGLIDKLTVTAANVLDFQTLEEICPRNCMVFADKLYDIQKSEFILRAKGCHSGIIKKRNNKTKNKDLDHWKSQTRMPFEGTFSKLRKRAKFRGRVKVLMQCYFEALTHNLKKAVIHLPLETRLA
jgi:transposase, IS5 family